MASKIASGNNLIMKTVRESEFGKLPTTPVIKQQRFTTHSPSYTKTENNDPTVNSNRQDTDVRFTTRNLSFSLESVLSHENQDDLISSGMWSSWSTTDEDGQRVIEIGSGSTLVQNSFTIETDQTDIDAQRRFTGVTVNSMSFSSPLDNNTTVTYDMVGREEEKVTAKLGAATPYSNTPSYTHIDGSLDLSYVPTDDCIVQSFELSISNNVSTDFCWGESTAHSVTPARVEVTGSVTVFYTGPEINNAYIDGTEGSLNVVLKDEEGHEFEFDLKRIIATGADNPFTEGNRVITLPFRALAAKDGSHGALTIKARGYTDLPTPKARKVQAD